MSRVIIPPNLGLPPIRRAGAFNPRAYSNLTLWYQSDLGVTKDGSNNVTALANQASGSFSLTGTGLWVATVTGNSYPGLTFPNSGDKLAQNSAVLASPPATIFAAVRTDALAAAEVIYDSNGAGARQFIQLPLVGTVRFNAGSSRDNTTTSWASRNLVIVILLNGASTTVRVNGTPASGDPASAGTNGLGSFCLGNVSSSGQPFKGAIQMFLYYSAARSAGEISAIEAALTKKYGTS